MDKISKKIKMINIIKKLIISKNIDGYILPKNDKYFTEYSKINYLKLVSNFSGSAGFALILKNKNYLFVDGRYTIQAKNESGNKFIICEIPYVWPKNILKKFKEKLNIGFDPKLFTYSRLNKYFENSCNLVSINKDLFHSKTFFSINHQNQWVRASKKYSAAKTFKSSPAALRF